MGGRLRKGAGPGVPGPYRETVGEGFIPPGVLAAAETSRDAYMRPLQTFRERPGRVQVRKHCRGRACPAPTAMQILPFFVSPPDDLGF